MILRRRIAPMSLALALLAGSGGFALAQPAAAPKPAAASKPPAKHNSNAPIDWTADRIEVQDLQHRAILTGSVRAVQEEMTLTSDRATANYTGSIANADSSGQGGGPQIHRLDATGHVVVTRPDEVARGDYGIYDLDKRLITLIGHVTLDRSGPNPSSVRGGRLVIDLNTDHANMDGSAVGGTGSAGAGGRVSGRFTVPQHDDSNQGAAAQPSKTTPQPKPARH